MSEKKVGIKTKPVEAVKLPDQAIEELKADSAKSSDDVVRVNIFATKAMRRQWKGFAAIAGYNDMGAFIRFAVNEYIRNHPIVLTDLGKQ